MWKKETLLAAAFLLAVLFVSSCHSLPKHNKQGSVPVKKGSSPVKKGSLAMKKGSPKVKKGIPAQRVAEEVGMEGATGDCSAACVTTHSKIDLAIVMDQSGSIADYAGLWDEEKQFIQEIATDFKISVGGIHMGVTKFNSLAEVAVKFTDHTDSESFKKDVATFVHPGRGGTDFDRALKTAREGLFIAEAGMREDVSKVMVFITDGKTSSTPEAVKEETDKLKEMGVKIYAIGVKSGNRTQLVQLVDGNENHVFMANDFGELKKKLYGQFTQIVCNSIVRDECSQKAKFDLGIILYGSMGTELYEQEKELVLTIADNYPITLGGVQTGVVRFSSAADTSLSIKLNKHMDADSFKEEVKGFTYHGNRKNSTNMRQALKVTREQLFTAENGMRADVPQVLIFITDGKLQPDSVQRTAAEADKLRAAVPGVRIYSVGVGGADREQLKSIFANGVEDDVIMATDFKEILNTVFEDLSVKICEDATSALKNKNVVEQLEVADNGDYTTVVGKSCDLRATPRVPYGKIVASLSEAKIICTGLGAKCVGILEQTSKSISNQDHTRFQFCALGGMNSETSPIDILHIHTSHYEREDDVYCAPSKNFQTGSPKTLSEAVDQCKAMDDCVAVQALVHKKRIPNQGWLKFQACPAKHNRHPTPPTHRQERGYFVYDVQAKK